MEPKVTEPNEPLDFSEWKRNSEGVLIIPADDEDWVDGWEEDERDS